MTRRDLLRLYRRAVLGVDLAGRTEVATGKILRSLRPARVALVAAGKSAGPMADAALRAIRSANVVHDVSLVVSPDGTIVSRCLRTLRAGHPLPDVRSVRAGRRALEIAAGLGHGDLLLLLVSGGASAALAAPRRGITLADKRSLTARLLRSGKTIAEINRARTRISDIKGGGLTRAAAPARVVSIVASDVAGDDPEVVGSGPGAGAPAILVAGPADLLDSAVRVAHDMGLRARRLPDASAPVEVLVERYLRLGRGVFVGVGEPTLRVVGRRPGGRSQHLALLLAWRTRHRGRFAFLAAGSDGRDGATDAAGAVVDQRTCNLLETLGLSPIGALERFATTRAHRLGGTAIPRWPSPVNLQDLHVIVP